MKNKRVLITGGLGFLGSNLARECLRQGAIVTLFDNLDEQAGGNLFNVKEIKESVRLIQQDIRDYGLVKKTVDGQDLIFHCAAYSSHTGAMNDPFSNIDVNCKGTLNLLEAVRHTSPKAKLVYAGTSTQTGKMIYSPMDENHPEFPLDIYSANKSLAEKYVLIYGNSYGLDVTVLRFANTYGPRAYIKSARLGFINYFIGLGLAGKKITVFGDGKQLRNVSFVEDSIAAMILTTQREEARGQVYFAVSKERYSVAQIAESIASVIGGQLEFIGWPQDRVAIEVGDALITNEKIYNNLGWSPTTTLAEGLSKTALFYRPNLKEYL